MFSAHGHILRSRVRIAIHKKFCAWNPWVSDSAWCWVHIHEPFGFSLESLANAPDARHWKNKSSTSPKKSRHMCKILQNNINAVCVFFSRLCSFNLNYCFGVKCQKNGLRLVDALIAACPFDQEAARESLAKTACSEAVDSVGRWPVDPVTATLIFSSIHRWSGSATWRSCWIAIERESRCNKLENYFYESKHLDLCYIALNAS